MEPFGLEVLLMLILLPFDGVYGGWYAAAVFLCELYSCLLLFSQMQ